MLININIIENYIPKGISKKRTTSVYRENRTVDVPAYLQLLRPIITCFLE